MDPTREIKAILGDMAMQIAVLQAQLREALEEAAAKAELLRQLREARDASDQAQEEPLRG